MLLNKPFPLAAVPSWVRQAILYQFNGRCPNIGEAAKVADRDWLKAPGIGPASLEMIRSVISEQQPHTASSSARLSEAELLRRLEWLQKELRGLEDQLKARLPKMAGRDETDSQELSQPSNNHA